jgi:hypothetical protein
MPTLVYVERGVRRQRRDDLRGRMVRGGVP